METRKGAAASLAEAVKPEAALVEPMRTKARSMRSSTELPMSDLRDAGDAIETVIELADYLPPGGMMLMLASRLRNDIREALKMPTLGRVKRGPARKPLDDLKTEDLERLHKAVGLLVGRCRQLIDDPELVALLSKLGDLTSTALERVRLKELEGAKVS